MQHIRSDKNAPSEMPTAMALSVIVPVYRQWEQLAVFLEHWANLANVPANIELIFIDNEPGSRPKDLVLPPAARVIDCSRPGSYAARNAGAAEAAGDWLIFTDADCRPDADWLIALAAAIAEHPESLLAGEVRMVLDGQLTPWARFDLVRGIPQRRYASRGYAATANLAVPAPLFHALGGFDTVRLSGGDAEFCRRAGAQGTSLFFVPDAIVAHPARADWDDLKTKARRVKGAQITKGAPRQRLYWIMRTLLPPVHEMFFYMQSRHPLKSRLTACAVRIRLWGVELMEAARLITGAKPERR